MKIKPKYVKNTLKIFLLSFLLFYFLPQLLFIFHLPSFCLSHSSPFSLTPQKLWQKQRWTYNGQSSNQANAGYVPQHQILWVQALKSLSECSSMLISMLIGQRLKLTAGSPEGHQASRPHFLPESLKEVRWRSIKSDSVHGEEVVLDETQDIHSGDPWSWPV